MREHVSLGERANVSVFARKIPVRIWLLSLMANMQHGELVYAHTCLACGCLSLYAHVHGWSDAAEGRGGRQCLIRALRFEVEVVHTTTTLLVGYVELGS